MMTSLNTMQDTEATSNKEFVQLHVQKGVCTVILNRPTKRNALSMMLIKELIEIFEDIARDSTIRIVILAGAGPAFCSGHDLKEIRQKQSEDFYRKLFDASSELMLKILTLPQPVIARVHGLASAAGCQLVATCDLAIAAESVTFDTPGVNIGLFCSTPMVPLSRNVSRKQAMRMLLSGESVTATRAFEMGLVSDVVPTEQLDKACEDLARLIASKSRQAIKIGKEAFYRQLELGIKEAYQYTGEVMIHNMSKDDAAEGIDAFLEKRSPKWQD